MLHSQCSRNVLWWVIKITSSPILWLNKFCGILTLTKLWNCLLRANKIKLANMHLFPIVGYLLFPQPSLNIDLLGVGWTTQYAPASAPLNNIRWSSRVFMSNFGTPPKIIVPFKVIPVWCGRQWSETLAHSFYAKFHVSTYAAGGQLTPNPWVYPGA